MKKLVGILVALVIVLGGLLTFEYVKDFKEAKTKGEAIPANTTKNVEKPTVTNKTTHFKDIQSMKKATTILQAFEGVFGKGRLFDDFKSNVSSVYDGEIKYNLMAVYNANNVPVQEWQNYDPVKQYVFYRVNINITMKPEVDTRMEMIDFLQYLKYSGLTKPHYIKESLPKDSVHVDTIIHGNVTPDKIQPFVINMKVFQPIKPGMNTPTPHQTWSISSEVIEKMDFNNKQDILNNITMYGKFEGYNPSGMK